MNYKEKPTYTHKTMCEMLQICRTWTMNNPSGLLPPLPVQWCDNVSQEENLRAIKDTMPEYKKTNWILLILMKMKII